jgi:hypothetical protein
MSDEYYSNEPEEYEETTDYSEEMAEEEDPSNPTILYFAYGIIHVWMAVLGFIIFGYYPGLMSSNTWWKVQCPSTSWNSVSVTAAKAALTADCDVPTATCP